MIFYCSDAVRASKINCQSFQRLTALNKFLHSNTLVVKIDFSYSLLITGFGLVAPKTTSTLFMLEEAIASYISAYDQHQ